jgi:hypothetical protein
MYVCMCGNGVLHIALGPTDPLVVAYISRKADLAQLGAKFCIGKFFLYIFHSFLDRIKKAGKSYFKLFFLKKKI